jgi:hypothetical protein
MSTEDKNTLKSQPEGNHQEKAQEKAMAAFFKEWVSKSLPLTLAISLAAFFYIFLVHKHVKKLSEMEKLKIENQELRSELIAIQTDLMTSSKQSALAARLSASGLKEMREPPRQLRKQSK